MKKVLFFLLALLVLGAAYVAWLLLGPATGFDGKKEVLYIRTKAANKAAVLDSLRQNNIVRNESAFSFLADRMQLWNNIKPGKYEIEKGSNLLAIVRKLRNGQQTPVNLTITKLRTKEDLARLISRRMEVDSAQMLDYINNNNFLKEHNRSAEAAMTLVLPDTYTYFWNASPETIFGKLVQASEKFWNDERKRKAEALGITPEQAYIIASIVDEESNKLEEKDTIASVYLNRIRIGMPLQADPTVKFALRDFALTRIYGEHLNVASPYNTYRNRGLPPGPICTPSPKTIDEVLAAPQTDYIYFVAHPALNGTHVFSSNYAEHMRKAKQYQQAYREWAAARNAKVTATPLMSLPKKIEKHLTTTAPVQVLIKRSKQTFIPGFSGISLFEVWPRFVQQLRNTSLLERASGISFNVVMAIPPTLMFIFTLIPYLPISARFIQELFNLVRTIVPGHENNRVIIAFLDDFLNRPRGELLSFGLLLALFFSSNAMMGILRSFDKNYEGFGDPTGLQKRAMALQLTLVVFVLFFVCLLLLIAQGAVLQWIGIESYALRLLIVNVRWVILFLLVFFIVSFIYRHGPPLKEKWPYITPGSVFATTLMFIATALVSFWINNFAYYNKLYGSISAIMILMILIYVNAVVILVGFELNVTIASLKRLKAAKKEMEAQNL